jgi:predicted amidohydrolase YtcJ
VRTVTFTYLVPSALVVAAGIGLTARQQPAPDLVIHHARIYTVNPKQPVAEALVVRGSRIVFVGKSDDALAMKAASTHVIDLAGATVVPGLQDAHGHFTSLGQSLQRLDFRNTTSYDQIVEMVHQAAAKARPGEWILGRAWDQNRWPEKVFPTSDRLDAAAPDNPVYLTRVDGHAGLANHKALAAGGVTRDSRAPEGGEIIRDKDGNPTGVLVDNAKELVESKIPPPTREQVVEQMLLADKECRHLGLTMIGDAGVPGQLIEEGYKPLVDSGKLQTRIYAMLSGTLDELRPYFQHGPIEDYHDYHLVVRAIKQYADGALGSYGAALLAPYSDRPETRGLLVTSPEELYEKTLAASKAGFQTCIHAIGDRANREVLDIFERVEKEVPSARQLRMRVEHAQILNAQDIPRFARLNVIASMQPTHATSDMPWVPARLGVDRMYEGAYVWRKILQTGATIASGSDFPVEEPNPMYGFYAAITRQDRNGNPPGGWMPDQKMTRQEALESFTINAAYAEHLEYELGSLEAGKLADFVVLSRDIMTAAPPDILTTRVLKTVTGGRIVYDAASASTAGR